MEVLDIDWKNIDSVFVKDNFYEDIQAPKWLDFLAPEEPVDDDAWFCKPDCKHPKNAANLVKSPLIPSPKERRPRSANSSSTSVSVSSISPLGERAASNLKGKRTRGPLSASVTSLYEFKSKENASENLKISTFLDKKYGTNSKLQSAASSKRRGHSENDNPNRPRSISAAPSSGGALKVQSQKASVSSSRQSNSVKASQSPGGSQKKGDVQQGLRNVSTDSTSASTPVRSAKRTASKASANERKSPSMKSGLALKETFSARNLFGRTTGKEFFSQLSEFCSELKKLALNSAQADTTSAKQPKNPCKQESNGHKTKEGAQDANGNRSEFGRPFLPSSSGCPSGRSAHNGSEADTITTTSSVGDPDPCTVSDPREQGGLRHRNNTTTTARICPKFNEQRKKTNDSNKKENVPPKRQEDDEKDHREDILRQTLENMKNRQSTHDGTNIPQKVKNRKDFNVSSVHSFSGPIPSQKYDIDVHSMDSGLQKDGGCSSSPNKMVKEQPHKKPLHAKIFSPNRWKKSRNDSIDQSADCSKKESCKPEQKVQSCPPSPQNFSRSSHALSPPSQGKKPKTTTPVQPFRFRTMERGILRELESGKKMGRSSASTDNIFATPESKLLLSDVFWFLKRCA